MFPLCTSVTLFRPFASAYLMARRTRRLVPVGEIGLIPTPESQRICFFPSFSISLFKNSSSFFTSGVPDFHSIPMYTSSVFSRKIMTSIFSGARTGEGTPGKYLTGRSQRSEEHTSELQSRLHLVCRLLLEKK